MEKILAIDLYNHFKNAIKKLLKIKITILNKLKNIEKEFKKYDNSR